MELVQIYFIKKIKVNTILNFFNFWISADSDYFRLIIIWLSLKKPPEVVH